MFIRFIKDFNGVLKNGQQIKHVRYGHGQKIFVDSITSTLNGNGNNHTNYLITMGRVDLVVPKDTIEVG